MKVKTRFIQRLILQQHSFTSVFETSPGIMKRAPLGSRSSGGVASSSPISSIDALITESAVLYCCQIDHLEKGKYLPSCWLEDNNDLSPHCYCHIAPRQMNRMITKLTATRFSWLLGLWWRLNIRHWQPLHGQVSWTIEHLKRDSSAPRALKKHRHVQNFAFSLQDRSILIASNHYFTLYFKFKFKKYWTSVYNRCALWFAT